MKSIIVKLIGVTALFAAFTVSAETLESDTVSLPLNWPTIVETPILTFQGDMTPGGIGCSPDASPTSYLCYNEYKPSSDNRTGTSHIYLYVMGRDPFKTLVTYNHTAKIVSRFETGNFNGSEKAKPAIVSGLIQSSGTLGTGVGSVEGWAAFGVKVEIYMSPTDNFENAQLIGGTTAVSEGCSSTMPNTLELFEPCRNVFSNDVPVSIPVLLTENSFYYVMVTNSCDAQGMDVSCYGTEFIFDIDDKDSKGIRTVATDFVVSVASERVAESDLTRASQSSVDNLLGSVSALQASVISLQTSVSTLQASVDANQSTNQSNFDDLTRLVKCKSKKCKPKK